MTSISLLTDWINVIFDLWPIQQKIIILFFFLEYRLTNLPLNLVKSSCLVFSSFLGIYNLAWKIWRGIIYYLEIHYNCNRDTIWQKKGLCGQFMVKVIICDVDTITRIWWHLILVFLSNSFCSPLFEKQVKEKKT